VDADHEQFVLKGGGYKALGGVLLGGLTLLGASAAASGSPGAIAFGIVFAVVMGSATWRWVSAQVRVTPAQLVLRTPWRTHRLAWQQVSGARILPTNANKFFCVVQVTCADGTTVKVDGVGSRYRNAGVGSAVAHAVNLIQRYSLPPVERP
jgi:hypothetical protein